MLQYPKDEIGELTHSFNVMLDDLKKAGSEKEEYYNKVISQNQELTLLNSR
ncbi:HAMP domain-containing protein [Anaerobacillus sp. HL2]|nr:HAMP domain-containing protein [Anaerobacillus sp. HL2]